MNLKSLLPFERYTLVTTLKEEEVMRRLEANVSPKKSISLLVVSRYGPKKDPADKPYTGAITGPCFEIMRVINYRNSFLPIVKGEVIHFLGKTEIKVKSSPHIAVLVFSAFWMSVVLLICVAMLLAAIGDHSEKFDPAGLTPFGMLVFGSLLFTIPYKIEAKKTKQFLLDLLDSEEVKEA